MGEARIVSREVLNLELMTRALQASVRFLETLDFLLGQWPKQIRGPSDPTDRRTL